MSILCKKCKSFDHVKNGIVRGKQRYRCKRCGYNFISIDRRQSKSNPALKAMCMLMYSLNKGTFRCLGEICGVAHTTVYRWIRKAAEELPLPQISPKIEDVEIDEMWHFLDKKKQAMDSQSCRQMDSENNCLGNRATKYRNV